MSTRNSNPTIPNAAQLTETRQKQWHQQGEALLTLENLRSWLNAAGLVLFAPRPQIVAPAPTFVEAVLGETNPSPTLEQIANARGLLARLVAEGLAVPLNLMGASGPGVQGAVGESPDFVASTAVFSYIFTLRGDKAWKQPPTSSGALKTSPLAVATFEALTSRGPLTAFDLAVELGKEVTEAAVLRALGELWTHLRVLPAPMPNGQPTVWELVSTRFTKQIKAGANAGQPAALSALISLYLGQAVVASEEDIENFLSPLAARSRIRDVVHALLAARQLESLAVEGRSVVHVTGELPVFLAPATPEAEAGSETQATIAVDTLKAGTDAADEPEAEAASRITKYVPKPRKVGTGYLAKASPSKFAAKPFTGSKPRKEGFGSKPRFGSSPTPDRERRPFKKPVFGAPARSFDKPWEEEKARRLAAASKPSEVDATPFDQAELRAPAEATPRAPRPFKPGAPGRASETRDGAQSRSDGSKRPYGARPTFGAKPRFGSKPSFGNKFRFDDARPPKREFTSRTEGDSREGSPPRKTFSKPGTFGRKREGFGGRPGSDSDFNSKAARPPRRDFASSGESKGFAPRNPYPPRASGSFSARPKPFDGRSERPVKPEWRGNDRDNRSRGERPDRGTTTESGKKVYRKFDAPRDRPARGFSSDRPARPGGFAGKPRGDFAPRKFSGERPAPRNSSGSSDRRASGKPGGFSGKKPFGKSGGFAQKPASGSTFAKFVGNKKPFGKRAPARKYKPKEDESA